MTVRTTLAALLCGAAIAAAPAVAGLTYDFGPHLGPTTPGPHSRIGWKSNERTLELPGKQLSNRCRFLRGEYRLRHGASKPDSLRPFHGCQLWRLDHDYHSSIDHFLAVVAMSHHPSLVLIAQVELILIRAQPGSY